MARLLLRWHGHSCFELEFEGAKLLLDPHDGGSLGVGFSPPNSKPNYVVVTHEHYDHNAVSVVEHEGLEAIVRGDTGSFRLGPYRLRGVRLPHDEFNGRLRGMVTAYRVEAGDITVVHLSDLGRPLEPDEAAELGPADVVLAPVGGVYTMHPSQVLGSAELLGARIVVPMHYWLPGIQLPLEPLDVFLAYAKKWRVVRLETSALEVGPGELPEQPTVAVLRLGSL